MIPFFHLLSYPRRLLHPHKVPPPRNARHSEGSEIHSSLAETPDQSEPLPLEIGLSPLACPSALPEHLVDAVRRLKPFLPIRCEVLGQGDVKIIGSHPIDAGGFADVWRGERNDGTTVAIKSLRHYSSSSCLPVYSVSDQYPLTRVLCSLKVSGRGCTMKR